MRNGRIRPRGYVLLESLAAGVILAISLGLVFNVIIEGRRMVQDAANRARAMRVAQDITERERNKVYSALSSVAPTPVPGVTGMTAEVIVTPTSQTANGFTWQVKEVETRINYIYRRQPTTLKVTMVRAP